MVKEAVEGLTNWVLIDYAQQTLCIIYNFFKASLTTLLFHTTLSLRSGLVQLKLWECSHNDGQGFLLFQKRLSQGKFNGCPPNHGQAAHALEARELQLLFWNGDPGLGVGAPLWRPLPGPG